MLISAFILIFWVTLSKSPGIKSGELSIFIISKSSSNPNRIAFYMLEEELTFIVSQLCACYFIDIISINLQNNYFYSYINIF